MLSAVFNLRNGETNWGSHAIASTGRRPARGGGAAMVSGTTATTTKSLQLAHAARSLPSRRRYPTTTLAPFDIYYYQHGLAVAPVPATLACLRARLSGLARSLACSLTRSLACLLSCSLAPSLAQ